MQAAINSLITSPKSITDEVVPAPVFIITTVSEQIRESEIAEFEQAEK